MPTGSLIPHLYIQRSPMPLSIYIAWLIFAFRITFHGGRTRIELDTNREELYTTVFTFWHGRNEFWHPDQHFITQTVWKAEAESQHWVALATVLEEHGFPWAKTQTLDTDIIQCFDAEVEGSIFGIKNHALFG
jgi:hypothetical protein